MQIAKGLCHKDDQIQNINEVKMTTDYLNETYPQQSASLMNLIMNIESELNFPRPDEDED
jgi:acyl carrier protein